MNKSVMTYKEECDALRLENESLRTQLATHEATIKVLREALEGCKGNINPERGYADEVEEEIAAALALPESNEALRAFGIRVAYKFDEFHTDEEVEAIVDEVLNARP